MEDRLVLQESHWALPRLLSRSWPPPLLQLLNAWRSCILEEASRGAALPAVVRGDREGFRDEPVGTFDPSGMDAVGLIFLCSVEGQIRRGALELLYVVRALHHDLAALAGAPGRNGALEEEPPPTYVIDIIEEVGEEMVRRVYFDNGKWVEAMRHEGEPVPADVSIFGVLEGGDQGRWGRCLSELVKYVAALCPASCQGARLEVVARLSTITPVDSFGKPTPYTYSLESDSKIEQWHLYCMFACACPAEDAVDGGVQSVRELMRLVMPCLKSGNDAQQYAAMSALGRAHPDIYGIMMSELDAFVEDVAAGRLERPKWGKSHKPVRDDVRMWVAQIYRLVAESLWPGMLATRAELREAIMRFIEDQYKFINGATTDTFYEAQPVR
jgi:hypothetical protein